MNNAVYGGMFNDTLLGYRCNHCGNIFQSMWGETCNSCRTQLKILKELQKENEVSDET